MQLVNRMNLLSRIFFSLFYLRKPPWDTGISPPELMAFIQSHQPGRALDLGCGTGTNAITLAKNGWQVTGVDFVSQAIRKARRKASRAQLNITFYRDDVTKLKGIEGPFDLILDIGCFHSLPEEGRAAYLININNLLAQGGTFMLYAYFSYPDESPTSLGRGIKEGDLEIFEPHLRLVKRQDGDDRGVRPSAWLWYQK